MCDICDKKIRSDKHMKTWDNLVVCKECYDPKHPQLDIRGRSENINVSPVRDRKPDRFVTNVDPDSLNGKY